MKDAERDVWRQNEAADGSRSVAPVLHTHPIGKALSPEEAEQIEWEMDQLVRLMGLHLARRPRAADWTDAALLGVLTRELRETPPREDDWSAKEVATIRERILGRVRDRRAGFRTFEGPPTTRPASVPGRPSVALKEAALERCGVHIDLAVAAGSGREIWDAECDQWVECPPDIPAGEYLSMPVSGDSMLPLLHAHDTILVKVSPDVTQGSIVVARDRDDRYVVKRVGRLGARRIELISENPAYEPITIRRSRGAIVGTVVLRWCAHGKEGVIPSG